MNAPLAFPFRYAIMGRVRSEGGLFERNSSRIRGRLKRLFLIRLFSCKGESKNGLFEGQDQAHLLPLSGRRLRQRHDHLRLLHHGHRHGGPVSRPRRHGGSCRGGPGLEHHLQPGPADGHWRQRDLQHQARQRPAGRQRRSVFHRFRTGSPRVLRCWPGQGFSGWKGPF